LNIIILCFGVASPPPFSCSSSSISVSKSLLIAVIIIIYIHITMCTAKCALSNYSSSKVLSARYILLRVLLHESLGSCNKLIIKKIELDPCRLYYPPTFTYGKFNMSV